MNREKPKQKVFRKGSCPTPIQRIHKRYEDWGRTGFFTAQGMENSISVWGWYLNTILIYPLSLSLPTSNLLASLVSYSFKIHSESNHFSSPPLYHPSPGHYQLLPGQHQEPPHLPVSNLTCPQVPILLYFPHSQRNIYHLTEEDSYLFIVCLPF